MRGELGLVWTLPREISELPERLTLPPPPRAFDAVLTPPGSKSLTSRVLVLAALARGRSVIRNAEVAGEDGAAVLAAVTALGARIQTLEDGTLHVDGVGGTWPAAGLTLDLKGSGTGMRFLAASAALAAGPITLDGSARMRQRPIAELGALLERLGCGVEYLGAAGFPPLRITPPTGPLAVPNVLEVESFQSSQFVSGLLMMGVWLERGLTLRLKGPVTSASYIHMTLGLLARLGATVRTAENLHVIRVGGGGEGRGIGPFEYDIEPDASGAMYFWAGAALVGGARVRVPGLEVGSLQGDARFPEVLGRMGARVARGDGLVEVAAGRRLMPILADMGDMPDAAMTLAAVACFAQGTSILRGLRTLRLKECDRIAALQAELTKIGVTVQTPVQGDADAMTITPPSEGVDCSPGAEPVEFETYDDHRIAMSLALVGLRRGGVTIRNPACVAKTYPGFWGEFARLYS